MSDYPNLLVSFPRVNAYIQLRYDVNQKKKGLAMSDYPNVDAVIQGCVSRIQAEWPELRNEVAAMRKQLAESQSAMKQWRSIALQHSGLLVEKDKDIKQLVRLLAEAEADLTEWFSNDD